ncbi:hypothetical protein PIB30_029955 [Stylosanthes scabra]|uniref:Uncharacterized protein n=1 Tax=Stylosanthes scabra TaxID=79078 RepID=A0ABU6W9Z9_9FABA|nr:hypothetical protein [Stylosanthes scabra]
MARKNVSGSTKKEKGMAKREAKRPDKRSDSRCTPLKFRKIYDRLSDEKKALIDEMGLGAFQHLPNFYINHKVLIELVRSYDIFTNTISTSVGEFLITLEKVGHAFGLNCRGQYQKLILVHDNAFWMLSSHATKPTTE